MNSALELAKTTQKTWQENSISERVIYLQNLQRILLKNKEIYARLITTEMHKPITQAIAEVEKCTLLCDYYLENAESFLETKKIKTENSESYVSYEPLGVVLGVMPWNFPFWQVFRFAVPTLTAGNTVVVKHASNVPKCANIIQTIFEEAGFPKGCYQNLPIPSNKVAEVIANPIIKAVSLTGSEQAGIAVATEAGMLFEKF
jgi:succinate-semialdehyde dehydrogenase/glutarate-semialdehyde dehydrogenase